MNLVQQTGARAVAEYAVLAGADAKNFLQQLYTFLGSVRIGIGPEILVLLAGCTAIVGNTRKVMPGQYDIWIGFVVPEKDVVTRLQGLDQVVFQQQCFSLGARDSHFDTGDMRHHQADARRDIGFLEVGGDAFFQLPGLADIQHLAPAIEHAVNPRQQRQAGYK